MDSDDPIVDIIQGLTQVAAIAVTLKHIGTSWHEVFTGHCGTCRGTGRVTCKHVRFVLVTKEKDVGRAKAEAEGGTDGFRTNQHQAGSERDQAHFHTCMMEVQTMEMVDLGSEMDEKRVPWWEKRG
eukprot:scaffold2682_cov344-Pavlova_lutheri.AAC.5